MEFLVETIMKAFIERCGSEARGSDFVERKREFNLLKDQYNQTVESDDDLEFSGDLEVSDEHLGSINKTYYR